MIGFIVVTAGVLATLGFAWVVGMVAEYFGISKG